MWGTLIAVGCTALSAWCLLLSIIEDSERWTEHLDSLDRDE
jgi:hypothetical protein